MIFSMFVRELKVFLKNGDSRAIIKIPTPVPTNIGTNNKLKITLWKNTCGKLEGQANARPPRLSEPESIYVLYLCSKK